MSDQIIGLHEWFQTPAGQTLLDWERAQVDHAVADIFGYHALQLGLPEMDGLQANRMPHQWLGLDRPTAWIWCCCHIRWSSAPTRMPLCVKWNGC
jgi:hypothetical protein